MAYDNYAMYMGHFVYEVHTAIGLHFYTTFVHIVEEKYYQAYLQVKEWVAEHTNQRMGNRIVRVSANMA